MSFNERLANRIRQKLENFNNIEEKQMMGGLTFMYNSKMCIGIIKDEMMCRIDPELHDQALEKKGCRPMDFTGKPMKGFVMVNDMGMKTQNEFDYWINLCLEFNQKVKSKKKTK